MTYIQSWTRINYTFLYREINFTYRLSFSFHLEKKFSSIFRDNHVYFEISKCDDIHISDLKTILKISHLYLTIWSVQYFYLIFFFNLSISIFPNQPRNSLSSPILFFPPFHLPRQVLKLFFFWKPNNSSRLSREEWFEIESKFKNSACKEDDKHNTTENKFCCHAPYWTQVERCTFPRQK